MWRHRWPPAHTADMATYSHTPKTDGLVVAYEEYIPGRRPSPNQHFAQLHANGCRHLQQRAYEVGSEHVPADNTQYGDDYYYVAPCARKVGGEKS